jgi:hypothetical protein
MSYSRWSSSEWYIYWVSYDDTPTPIEEQHLAVWLAGGDTHPELSFYEVLRVLAKNDFTRITDADPIPDKDILLLCLNRWVKDVIVEYHPDLKSLEEYATLAEHYTQKALHE